VSTEEELAALAQQGHTGAFEQLVKATSQRLFTVCYRVLRNEQLADEAVQETFLKAYRKLGQFNGQARFSTWIHTIAHRSALEILRKQRRIQEDDGLETDRQATDDGQPDQYLAELSLEQAVKRCLDRMNPDLRVAFVLRHFEDCTIEDISEITQSNSNTVKGRIFRAVSLLRQQLSNYRNSDFEEESV
jgi:RNA polymerase sigma-70 factor (ECF subfamily)